MMHFSRCPSKTFKQNKSNWSSLTVTKTSEKMKKTLTKNHKFIKPHNKNWWKYWKLYSSLSFSCNPSLSDLSHFLIYSLLFENNLANIYLFKFNSTNTKRRCEICSKLPIKTREPRQWRRSRVFIVKFEDISYLFLVFLLLTLSK